MATIREVKKELRQREWAEEIAECQSSGMKIRNWCQMKGISCNTYYRRLQIVRTELLAQTEQSMQQIVPLSSAMALQSSAPEPMLKGSAACEKIMIRKCIRRRVRATCTDFESQCAGQSEPPCRT